MSRDGVIFGYDYENRLVSAGSVGYTYDADGIRVSSASDGSATDYLVDKNRQYAQVLEEKNGSASVSYVHGDDLISRKQDGEVRYYVYDGHGSVRHLTDADGTVTDSYIYDAFGNLKDHLGDSDNRYLYAGEQYDPDAGLYYLRARYYDPESGRFMTHDPYVGNPDEPVTLHRYLYGNANPVTYIDPSGRFSSLLELTTSFVIRSTIRSIRLTGISHVASSLLSKSTVEWSGSMTIGTMGAPVPLAFGWGVPWSVGGGGILVDLETKGENGERKGKGVFLIAVYGMVAGPGYWNVINPPSITWSFCNMVTPGIFGARPLILAGPASFISVTWCLGGGYSAAVTRRRAL